MIVAGLDLSLRSTGLAVLDGDSLIVAKVVTSAGGGIKRVAELGTRIIEEVLAAAGGPPSLWVLEGYALGVTRAASSLADLAELGGVVKLSIWRRQEDFLVVPPARLKRFVCGRGNARKDEMRLWVYKRWGFEHPSPDVIDAYALARFGLGVLDDTGLKASEKMIVRAAESEIVRPKRQSIGVAAG